ncbi:MAG: carbohydrate kinase family protein [Candidatus Eremiobacteraeota bacterium]|nr:carbohydrate kinase family protein [Candidatus Eremiobacteraeota bacterium]
MEQPVIIGGASVDLKGRPFAKLKPRTSTIGRLERSFGGVGFNIAQNLAMLGVIPHFITIVGNDPEGHSILEECGRNGIATKLIEINADEHTAIFEAILDENGDLYGGISAMAIFDRITPEVLEPYEALLGKAPLVVTDCNIPQHTIEYIADFCSARRVPLWVEPTSTDKAPKILSRIAQVTYLSPNKEELETLLDMPLFSYPEMTDGARRLIRKGLEHLFITLGSDGVMWLAGEKALHRRSREVTTKDVTGAGDAFAAGVIWAILEGIPIDRAISYGMAAAIATLQVYKSVHPSLSSSLLESIMKDFFPNEQ